MIEEQLKRGVLPAIRKFFFIMHLGDEFTGLALDCWTELAEREHNLLQHIVMDCIRSLHGFESLYKSSRISCPPLITYMNASSSLRPQYFCVIFCFLPFEDIINPATYLLETLYIEGIPHSTSLLKHKVMAS